MRAREILEGTWSFPDTTEKVEKLKHVLSRPVTASDAKIILFDIIGNDDLVDHINVVTADEPDMPINDHVMQWLRHNYHDIFIQLAKLKDWEGMVHKDEQMIDRVGRLSPLGHGETD